MDKKNLVDLGSSELAALERFRQRRARLEAVLKTTEPKPSSSTPEENIVNRPATERENKAAALKIQMVALINDEIHKLFKTGLDDGKLITLDIESDSGKVISPENLSKEKLSEMSLSDLNKIRFRVDILNQIIESARKIYCKKFNMVEILQQAGVPNAKSYEIVQQASDETEFLEFFCYVLTQETSMNLMTLFYACKNFLAKCQV